MDNSTNMHTRREYRIVLKHVIRMFLFSASNLPDMFEFSSVTNICGPAEVDLIIRNADVCTIAVVCRRYI